VHLLVLQLLARVALAGLRQVSGLAVSAQAVCRARQRLPLSVWLALVDRSGGAGEDTSTSSSSSLWHGMRVLLADGLSVLAPDAPGVAGRYGRAANQHGTSASYPMPKLLAMVDWSTGLILRVIGLPHGRNEKVCLGRLLGHAGPGDLLLADRGLVSFAHVALMAARGVACCCRLPACMTVTGRGRGGCRRLLRELGAHDRLVRWLRPDRRPAAWMTRAAWAALPDELVLRQVGRRVSRAGFRDRWLWVVTTLTDAAAHPAAEVLDLYGRRWRVEVCFRDLKATLGMGRLRSRTLAGVRKEVAAFVLLYNLVRRVMCRAAAARGVDPDRVGFADACRWVLWAGPGDPPPVLVINPRRPDRPPSRGP
jgi:hypothetical protein